VQRAERRTGTVDYVVRSRGVGAIAEPSHVLDCGNSGTTMRLFAGILAGVPVEAILDGDASLRTRPMGRIIEPLRAMGAALDGAGADRARAPLAIRGRRPLEPIDWTTPVPSAQVKSAILLAGLAGAGTTTVRESVATRDHTERMLRARGVAVRSRAGIGGGTVIEIDGGVGLEPRDQVVPGDPSAGAFWLVAAATHRDAQVRIRGVGVNPTRRSIIDLLRRMGASIEEMAQPDAGGEPIADLTVDSSQLEAIEVTASETAASIDEIPVLSLAATQASGTTVIRGAGELRHKESDRLAGVVAGLRAFGARIDANGDDIVIEGPSELHGAVVDSLGDHRLAMTFAIAGLIADRTTTIRDAQSVSISYPSFFADLERIRS
jgi:3-phosphoshikimate 1-carboxyvinyltransferase